MAQVDEVAELVRDGVPAALRVGSRAHEDVAVLFRLVLNQPALEGIRVELLAELCEDTGIAYNLKPISEADVRSADEVLLTSATKEVIAVTRVDGESVGHGALRGKPGPVYARLYEAYQRAKDLQSI